MYYQHFWGNVEHTMQLYLYEAGHKPLGKNSWTGCREGFLERYRRVESPSQKQSFQECILLFSGD